MPSYIIKGGNTSSPGNRNIALITTESVDYDLSAFQSNGDPTITGLSITNVEWTTDGSITIRRGANTWFNLTAGQHSMDLAGRGVALNADAGASVNVVMTGNGTLILEMAKLPNHITAY